VPRLTPEQLARFRADYHQCATTVMPLVLECEALIAERDAARAEVARLQRQVEGHCGRIARQAELLSRRAEKGSEAVRDIVLGLLQYVEHEDGCEYYQMGKPHPCTCGLGKYTELWASLAKEGGG
jgi:hypothetical protein